MHAPGPVSFELQREWEALDRPLAYRSGELSLVVEAMTLLLSRPPVTSVFHMPSYSNMAYQLLAYAIESITGQSFADTVTKALVEPLGLSRTFLSNPGNDSNAIIAEGWTEDLGDENP